jgi:DNA repair protein RadD
VLWFTVGVDHCHHVADAIRRAGQPAAVVTGKTPDHERKQITAAFVRGSIRHLVNVNVLTEGFDATRTDAIVLLRPTQSRGLYTQMVGRGLRLHPEKADCLVLDFAGAIQAHGPLDLMGHGEVQTAVCLKCSEVFSRGIGQCPACGEPLPKLVREEAEREAAERRLHGTRHIDADIISSNVPETFAVTDIHVRRHRKQGAPDSLRVTYQIGLVQAHEWICLDHGGYAQHKAARWWRTRFGDPVPTVDQALDDLFLASKLKDMTEAVTVRRDGKYLEIVSVRLRELQRTRTY